MKKLVFYMPLFILLMFTTCSTSTAVSSSIAIGIEEISRGIRDVSDYLNDHIPAGSMCVFVNIESHSEELSAFIFDELTTNAVNDRVFTVVDRQRLDLIRAEQGFQLSGEVDDESALSIGRFLGAHTIISGRVSSLGDNFRLTIRALHVETAQVQGQFIQNIGTTRTISALTGSSGVQQTRQNQNQQPGRTTIQLPSQQAAQVAPVTPVQLTLPVVVVEGGSLLERLRWIDASASNNTLYHIDITENESISPQILSFSRARNVTVRLSGSGTEWFISLTGPGSLFTIGPSVTLILENGVTLEGHNNNMGGWLVRINKDGTLIMNDGAKILRNNYSLIYSDGTFTMNGGEIDTSSCSNYGVFIQSGGLFTKTGGTIYERRDSSTNVTVQSQIGMRRTTAGPSVRMDSRISGAAGGWESV